MSADSTTATTAAAGVATASAADASVAAGRRPPADVVAAGDGGTKVDSVRHVSVPQMDPRPRRQEMMNRPSTKELMVYQQGRSNSASSSADRAGQHRTSGRRSPAVYGGGGNGGGFKSKLRNSFRSTAKRIRQQQTAIDALAKNSQTLGLHNLQENPRTTTAQRTLSRVRIYNNTYVFKKDGFVRRRASLMQTIESIAFDLLSMNADRLEKILYFLKRALVCDVLGGDFCTHRISFCLAEDI